LRCGKFRPAAGSYHIFRMSVLGPVASRRATTKISHWQADTVQVAVPKVLRRDQPLSRVWSDRGMRQPGETPGPTARSKTPAILRLAPDHSDAQASTSFRACAGHLRCSLNPTAATVARVRGRGRAALCCVAPNSRSKRSVWTIRSFRTVVWLIGLIAFSVLASDQLPMSKFDYVVSWSIG
jgi:hypothetical protein